MAGAACGVAGDSELSTVTAVELSSTTFRKRRREVLHLDTGASKRRQRVEVKTCRECSNEFDYSESKNSRNDNKDGLELIGNGKFMKIGQEKPPSFGMTSLCGRRRDMEDAVSIHTSFSDDGSHSSDLHFFGVFDGHGCSHVATRCKDRMHEIVKQELQDSHESIKWDEIMHRSFERMDTDVKDWSQVTKSSTCRCELQAPHRDVVGSTAVVSVVTPDKIIVSNCGDSRVVLCRNGVAIPLSSDHKPDRPDELLRIENAGGQVIYWDGPRVLGVLAMSRAIGDDYLKPFVIPEPEVTITNRTDEDECLILASDGLWDVVSNETACSVAYMCLRAHRYSSLSQSSGLNIVGNSGSVESSNKVCSDASILLTKLAFARNSWDNISVVVVDLRRNSV